MQQSYAGFTRMANRLANAASLVNIEQEDQPLVAVNDQFCELTGYGREQILGRNCRFLQGKDTDSMSTKYIRDSIAGSRAIYCDLLNYKQNGQTFYNRLVLFPTIWAEQKHYVGMQIDATASVDQLLDKYPHTTFDQVKTSDYLTGLLTNKLETLWIMDEVPYREELALKFADIADDICKIVRSLPYEEPSGATH